MEALDASDQGQRGHLQKSNIGRMKVTSPHLDGQQEITKQQLELGMCAAEDFIHNYDFWPLQMWVRFLLTSCSCKSAPFVFSST